jgi:hypothetical protein
MTARSKNRLMYLLDRLDRIRHAALPSDAEEAMTDFTFELLHLRILKESLQQQQQQQQQQPETVVFHKGDETMLMDLESHGAISTILETMHRFFGRAAPEFYNSACIALVHLCFQSKGRSEVIYRQGGVGIVIQMMQCYRSFDYIQVIGIAALMVIGKNLGLYLLFDLEATILQQIVVAMECHQESSRVYMVACSALGTLFGPGSSSVICQGGDDENVLYHRALNAIAYGLILHLDDQVAQGVGSALLCNMVGPDVAEEMIAYVENTHGGVCCAAAA